jgi:hypothetical protein
MNNMNNKSQQSIKSLKKTNWNMKKVIISIIWLTYLIGILSIVSVHALAINSVAVSPIQIEPGKKADILIDLDNNGNGNIKDVSVSLNFDNVPFAPSDSGSEVNFDEIKKDKSKSADFTVIALNNAQSGIYKIPVIISYTEESNSQPGIQTTLISLTVNSKPIIDVQSGDNSLIKNQEGTLSIKVVNKGLSDIKFLEVEISNPGFTLLSSNKVYIGDLSSNDFDTAEFKGFFLTTTPDTLNIPVTITYKDILNNEFTDNYNVPVKIYSQQKAIELGLIQKSNSALYLGIIIVLIIIYFVYRRFKKSRRLNKTNSEIAF